MSRLSSNWLDPSSKLDRYPSSSEDEGPRKRKVLRKDVNQLEKEKELSGYEGDIDSASSQSRKSCPLCAKCPSPSSCAKCLSTSNSSSLSSSSDGSSSSSSSNSKGSNSSSSSSDESGSNSNSSSSNVVKSVGTSSSLPKDENSSESTIIYDEGKEITEEPRKISNKTFRDPYEYLR